MKLRDLLELARVSNLPTVWSNAVLGYLAGAYVFGITRPEQTFGGAVSASELLESIAQAPASFIILLLMLIIPYSLLYTGGMVLNDYLDREVDAQERPHRPIPSGRVPANQALRLAVAFLILGVLGVGLLEYRYHWIEYAPWRATAFAAVLAVTIVSYNLSHQRNARTVLLMGACRGLVVLSAASIRQPPTFDSAWLGFVAGPAAALIAYTVLISIIARREVDHTQEPRRLGGPKTIMNMIAAMPLLDAVWLLVMGLWPASLFCVACAGLTKLGHRKVAGS